MHSLLDPIQIIFDKSTASKCNSFLLLIMCIMLYQEEESIVLSSTPWKYVEKIIYQLQWPGGSNWVQLHLAPLHAYLVTRKRYCRTLNEIRLIPFLPLSSDIEHICNVSIWIYVQGRYLENGKSGACFASISWCFLSLTIMTTVTVQQQWKSDVLVTAIATN